MELVESSDQLAIVVESLRREQRVALDTEGNSLHRYPERLCLVQVASKSSVYVVDPIAINDVTPLGALLADPLVEKVIHSSDYDIRSLDRDWHFQVQNLFDTSIAARFIGAKRIGLDALLKDSLAIDILKDDRLTHSDWTIRPLSARSLQYAADDVAHLLDLRESLVTNLKNLGRESWVSEECVRMGRIRYTKPDPPEISFVHLKGSHHLDGRGLAILRELVVFRDQEALRRGVPPYRIIANDALLFLAGNPDFQLIDVPGIGNSIIRNIGKNLEEAITVGMAAVPVTRVTSFTTAASRLTSAQAKRLSALKKWRNQMGSTLDLDPALLWPMASLQRLAKSPGSLNQELSLGDLRQWQWDVFRDQINECLLAS